MRVTIWNRKNNEVIGCFEWKHGRFTYKRFRMIVRYMFSFAADSSEYSYLEATLDNSPQRIEMHTFHHDFFYSVIDAWLTVDNKIVRVMNICN